ncbi:MAG TPA: GAF and ANTAR domain-containing protein [Pseudonocardiaceae bacterium]|nr:GAF and ANTAR domain-containing protein [Pseudonocardiaceae bacterium]
MDGQRRELLWRSVSDRVTDGATSWAGGICLVCVASLPAVDAAALTLRADSRAQELLAASDTWAAELEELQYTLGEGPGEVAVDSGQPVLVPDLTAEATRWPAFTSAASGTGAGAMFAFPLQLGGIRLGVLNLYRHAPGGLSHRELTDATLLAELSLAALLDHQERAESTEPGPDGAARPFGASYQDVHIATGVLAAELRISLVDAFARLRARAFADGRALQAVARDVLDRRIRFDQPAD